ncbi:MAG TPA: fused MFS/spermidine synthase, partial [Planctomycetaceae bacterium]|nr:fused MFS/spermidine synthase [Planctomycetaceae bacterium]
MPSDSTSQPRVTETPRPAALSPGFADQPRSGRPPQSRARTLGILIGCNALVFLSSVCVMVLELTASRLIAKSHGSSLYTWTSVIGVVLAGISLGNFLGGWLADRFTPRRVLAYVFWASSVGCLSVYSMHGLIAATERPDWFSWPAWVLFAVAAVFLVPALALGTISPLVASIALAQSQRTGTTVGNVYAWGALGSILGTFLTGFFLIDHFGTQHIIWMTSATLAILGAVVATGQWAFRAAVLCGWLQFVVWVGLFASTREAYASDNIHANSEGLARALHEV